MVSMTDSRYDEDAMSVDSFHSASSNPAESFVLEQQSANQVHPEEDNVVQQATPVQSAPAQLLTESESSYLTLLRELQQRFKVLSLVKHCIVITFTGLTFWLAYVAWVQSSISNNLSRYQNDLDFWQYCLQQNDSAGIMPEGCSERLKIGPHHHLREKNYRKHHWICLR